MIKLTPGACALALTWSMGLSTLYATDVPAPSSGIQYFEGSAYSSPSSKHLIYIESHWIYSDAGNASRLVLYRCPDGKPFARKLIHDDGDAQAPDFVLNDARDGYQEGVRSADGKRVVFVRQKKGTAEKAATLDTSPMPVIDAGFDAYIRNHWDTLGANASNTIPFLIPSRLGTLKFTVKREPDGSVNGRAARHYRLSLDSWIGFALPHIDVAYDANTRELLRFDGLANIRGSNGDNVKATINFDPSKDREVSPVNLQVAMKAPLDGQCQIP